MSAVVFQYVGVDAQGARRRGEVQALDQRDAYRQLRASGVTPTKLRTRARRLRTPSLAGSRVSVEELSQITRQLATLLQARISISDGVRSISEQERSPTLRRMLDSIADRIEAGSSIHESMRPHVKLLGEIYVETINAAERTGTMIQSLEALAETLDVRAEIQRSLRQAMLYPIVVTTALSLATLFLIAFVVPKFAGMYEARGVELPALTRGLQVFGLSLRSWWWLYGLGVCAGWFGMRFLARTPQGGAALDRFLLRTPYLSRVLLGLGVSRFARTLGSCLGSGLGLIESLEMAMRASGRPALRADAQIMLEHVRRGERLGDALGQCRWIPPFAKRMIAAGEESAELTRLCGVISKQYEREVMYLTKNAATVIEPALIAALTGVVLVIALAVFMPMWDMVTLVG